MPQHFGQGFIESFLAGADLAAQRQQAQQESEAFGLRKSLLEARLRNMKTQEKLQAAEAEAMRSTPPRISGPVVRSSKILYCRSLTCSLLRSRS